MDLIERAAAKLQRSARPAEDKAADTEVRERRLAAEAASAPRPEPIRDEPGTVHVIGLAPAPIAAPAAAPAERRTRNTVTIDVTRLRTQGLVTPFGARTRTDEEFRIVKRPLLLKAFAKGSDAVPNGHLIMVTSSHPGEGKTFCSVSLAMSIAAETDLNVLLVDADVLKPRVPDVLGLKCDQGLLDLVSDETLDFSDVLIRTNIENLSILPAGRPHPMATELFASERMGRIVEDMAHRYPDRVIIFDSPPTLASSVPGVLALHVGQIVFVVRAERTSESAVNAGLAAVGNCKNIGLLLNRTRNMIGSGGLYPYYGYGYGAQRS